MRRKLESVRRFFTPPVDHFFLLGPRGTGKTWWTRQEFPEALRVDLLDPEMLRAMAAHPERLRARVAAMPGVKQVVIDEVQKLPELLEVAHWMIEEKGGVQFIFTGSSARKLRRGGVNLLGGRAAQKSLHPFMAAELGGRFRLEEALRLGMLPVVHGAADPAEILRAYNGCICARRCWWLWSARTRCNRRWRWRSVECLPSYGTRSETCRPPPDQLGSRDHLR